MSSRRTIDDDLRLISQHVYYADAPELLGIDAARLDRYVQGYSAPRPGTANYEAIRNLAGAFRSKEYADLQTVSEYITFNDASKLLGTSTAHLNRVIKGQGRLDQAQARQLHQMAAKMRRREGQLKRVAIEETNRAARRSVHDQLRVIGMPDVKLPEYLPPFLRFHDHGKLETPVYIYDFRKVNTYKKVTEFFRFMKTVLPGGAFFLTYAVKPSGTSPNGGKNYYVNQDIVLSTPYMEFCRTTGSDIPGGSCLMMTDNEFYEYYTDISDVSAGRKVIECGVSHRRPPHTMPHFNLTPEEIAEDLALGRDWVLGKKIIWQD